MPASETHGLIMQELVRRSNEDSRRLRTIEQRVDSMEARLVALEDTLLDRTKKMNSKFAELDTTIKIASDELLMVKTTLERISRQMSSFARKQDLKEIEHMFDLLSPIRQEFVTKEQLDEELKQRDEVIR